jgi:NADH-quinone oxidoreductase subunit N
MKLDLLWIHGMLKYTLFIDFFIFYGVEFFFFLSIVFLLLFFLFFKLEFFFYFSGKFLKIISYNLTFYSSFIFLLEFFLIYSFFGKKGFNFFFDFYFDDFILFIKMILTLICFLFFFLFFAYLIYEQIFKSFEYFIILLFSVLSAFILSSSGELVVFYLALEVQSLTFYVLASSKQNSIFSIEAGLKYFVLGAFVSGFLLFGSSILYGCTGTTKFLELSYFFEKEYYSLFLYSSLFFFVPLFFKISAAPFHMWTPDVYEGSPTIITFFFSVVPKVVFLSLFIRLFFEVFFLFSDYGSFFLVFLCFFSLIIGSFGGLLQQKLKRLFAYSSINNIGFMLIGLVSGNIEGISSAILFFIVYFFANLGVFSFLVGLRYFSNFFKLKNIYEISGVLKTNSILVFIIVVVLFSFIGIPPLAGFFVKLILFINVFFSNWIFLILFAMFSSVVSSYYYLKIIRIALFKRFVGFIFFKPIDIFCAFLLVLVFFFTLFFFVDMIFLFKSLYEICISAFVFCSYFSL